MTLPSTPGHPDKGTNRDGAPRVRRVYEVSSQWIADKTGFGRTSVYRFRTDYENRPPSAFRMRRLQETFGWAMVDQVKADAVGRWVEEFERVVLDAYRKEQETK